MSNKVYEAIINTPGYLPWSDDRVTFDTARQAWEWLAEERSRAFFDLNDAKATITGLESILSQDQAGTVYLDTPGYEGDHDLGLAYNVVELAHSDYPHEPGRLHGCPACDARCHCTPETTTCVYEGEHDALADHAAITYGQLARELGFGEDFHGFLVWADLVNWQTSGLPGVAATDWADADAVVFLREAKIESDKHLID